MRCPSPGRLAAASLGADPRAELHAETCERCRAELAAMAEVGAFARRAPVRTASDDRRARIAALVMASSDARADLPVRRARMPFAMIAVAAVAAIAAVAVLAWRGRPEPAPYAIAWPVLPPPQVSHASAPVGARDTAALVAHDRAPLLTRTPVPNDVAETTAGSPVKARSAVHSSRVFAGSQQRAEGNDPSRDQITLAPPPIVVPVSAFKRGWTALREKRYADAIAAFDQATEPAVAEDAAYWAAIASARAGDRADAGRRLNAFVAQFPASVRTADARALLARLAP